MFIMFPTNMGKNCEFLNHSKGNHLCNASYSGLLHWQPMLLACLLSRLSNFSSANNSLVSRSHSDMLLIYSNRSNPKSLNSLRAVGPICHPIWPFSQHRIPKAVPCQNWLKDESIILSKCTSVPKCALPLSLSYFMCCDNIAFKFKMSISYFLNVLLI